MKDSSPNGEFSAFVEPYFKKYEPLHGILVDTIGGESCAWNLIHYRNWFGIFMEQDPKGYAWLSQRYAEHALNTIIVNTFCPEDSKGFSAEERDKMGWLGHELRYRCCPIDFEYLESEVDDVSGLLKGTNYRPGLIMMEHYGDPDGITEWISEFGYKWRWGNKVNAAWILG